MLSTFIYGDLSSITFALFSIYFIMKYTREKNLKYAIFSAGSMCISYMLRMNMLIFIIAISIYLFFDIISEKQDTKQILKKFGIMFMFLLIVVGPANIIKNYYLNKYNLEKNENFPVFGYIYMGMQEAYSSPGWFNYPIANVTFELGKEEASKMYKIVIKLRTEEIIKKPKYILAFYRDKTASMWAENTYAAIHYNLSRNFEGGKETYPDELDKKLIESESFLYIYQKALIIIIFGGSIAVLFENRKNISNELILLLTIFIGGFLFHTIWEAKSRYIIPYIVVLIPIASIEINKIKFKRMEKKDEFTKQTNSN